MPRNPYFNFGRVATEQDLYEDLIIEATNIYGQEFFYIPRTLVGTDPILGEDVLSQFNYSYPIVAYFDNIDSLDGQGSFMSKFGLTIEQSATISIPRREWETLVGEYCTSLLPNRPAEGDLLYFPLTKGLFEIRFVQHQDPFYQVGKLYVYKLTIELFQYSSERINTGDNFIDAFESLKSYDVDINPTAEDQDSFGDNEKFKSGSSNIIFDESNPFGEL